MRAKRAGRNQTIIWNGYIGLGEMLQELEGDHNWRAGNMKINESHLSLINKNKILIERCIAYEKDFELTDTICRFFDELLQHFCEEEIYLAEIDYPAVARHVEKHAILINGIKRFKMDYFNQDIKPNDLSMYFIGEALIMHLKEEDANIQQFLQTLKN